jgi:hypothetical protein
MEQWDWDRAGLVGSFRDYRSAWQQASSGPGRNTSPDASGSVSKIARPLESLVATSTFLRECPGMFPLEGPDSSARSAALRGTWPEAAQRCFHPAGRACRVNAGAGPWRDVRKPVRSRELAPLPPRAQSALFLSLNPAAQAAPLKIVKLCAPRQRSRFVPKQSRKFLLHLT